MDNNNIELTDNFLFEADPNTFSELEILKQLDSLPFVEFTEPEQIIIGDTDSELDCIIQENVYEDEVNGKEEVVEGDEYDRKNFEHYYETTHTRVEIPKTKKNARSACKHAALNFMIDYRRGTMKYKGKLLSDWKVETSSRSTRGTKNRSAKRVDHKYIYTPTNIVFPNLIGVLRMICALEGTKVPTQFTHKD